MKSVGDEKQENISKSTNVLDLQRKLMDLSEMDRSKFFIMFYTRQFVKRVSYYTNKLLSKYRCILVLVLPSSYLELLHRVVYALLT